jgi:hypothetical protein
MITRFDALIDQEFGYQISLDDLPAALDLIDSSQLLYGAPIPLGFKDGEGHYYVFNHLHFEVQTSGCKNQHNIAAFAVKPMSIDHLEMERQEKALAGKIASAASI